MKNGPLSGVKVIEFAGIGPGPFCGMLLSEVKDKEEFLDFTAKKKGRYNRPFSIKLLIYFLTTEKVDVLPFSSVTLNM